LGINDYGQIAGGYLGSDGLQHGFIEAGGIFTTIDNPLGVNGTVVSNINNSDQIVGYYFDANHVQHGFVSSFRADMTAENTPFVLTSLHVSDPAASDDPIQVSLSVGHGTLALNDATGLSVGSDDNQDLLTLTGSVAEIDAALAKGVVYTPASGFNGGDTLTITADDQGHNPAGIAASSTQTLDIPVVHALTGTILADTIVSTAANDMMTGGAGSDQFVFNAALGSTGHDIIADFAVGHDTIVLDYAAFNSDSFNSWLASHVKPANGGSDLSIDLSASGHDGQDTILLKNAAAGGLHASDFILHSH